MALNRLKVGRGLQPVPEESASNGIQADSSPDDAAAPAKLPDRCHNHAGNAARNKATATDRQFRSWGFDDLAAGRPLDGVSEKEYRIWFPRAEVADGDHTSRASSDWRTFREYRYTECSREGLLEKSLSVEQVHSSGKDSPTADAPQPAFPFHCVTCSMSDEDRSAKLGGGGPCRMLSSTKSQLYREHRERLLSRQEDDISSAAPLLKTEQKPKLSRASGEMGWEEGETTSECQTQPEKIELAGSSDNAKSGAEVPLPKEGTVSTSAEYLFSGDENEPSYQPGSAGFQDTSLVSEDDDFDDRKCTYVKVDSVDAEVEQGSRVGKETVIGGPSLDDLGYIAEEPEDEIEERAEDDPGSKRLAGTPTEKANQELESKRTSSSELESRHQEQVSTQSNVKEELNTGGERTDASKYSLNALYSPALDAADDVAARTKGEEDRSKCLVGYTEDSSFQEQHAKKDPERPREANDATEATAPLDHSLSETDANEHSSEARSVKSVISLPDEIAPLANTRGEIVDEELTNTIVEIGSQKERRTERRQSLVASQDLLSNKGITQGASNEASTAVEEQCEDTKNGATRHEDSLGGPKEVFKDVLVLVSDFLLNNDASDKVTSSTENEIAQRRENAAKVEEKEGLLKNLQESLYFAVIENSQALEGIPLPHHDEVQRLNQRRESVKHASTCDVEVKEYLEETTENIAATVSDSVTQKNVANVQTDIGDEKNKNQAEKTAEREQNHTIPKVLAVSNCERLQNDIADFFEADTLRKRSGDAPHRETFLTDAKENALTTLENVLTIVDDSISISDVTRGTQAKVREEGKDQREYANVGLKVNGRPENAPKVDAVPPEDAPEARILQESKVQRLSTLKRITGVEELVRETVTVVSSTHTDSLSEKNSVADESLRIVKDSIKKEETLNETKLHDFRIDSNEAAMSLLTNGTQEAREVEIVHDVQLFEESTAQSLGLDSVVANEETVDDMTNVSHSLPHDTHLINLGISSIRDKESQEDHGGLVAMKNTQEDALGYNPPTNVVLLEESLSASIEAGMLRDVIALTKIDDATSVDASLQDDNDQGFESLPCDQTLDSEDLNETQAKEEASDQREPQVGDVNNENADNLATLLNNLIGGEEDTKHSSSSEARNIIAEAGGHNRESAFAQYAEPHNVASSEHHDKQEKEGEGTESARLEGGERMTSARKPVETILGAPDEASNCVEGESVCDASEDNAEKGPEDTANKNLQCYISVPGEIEVLRQHEELHEQGRKAAQIETSEDFASEESASKRTDENETRRVSVETSASNTVEIVEAGETATGGETGNLGNVTEAAFTVHPEGPKTFRTELIMFDDIVGPDRQRESCEETTLRQETAEKLVSIELPLAIAECDQAPEAHAEAIQKQQDISETHEASEHSEIEQVGKAREEIVESSLDETKYGDIEHSDDSQVVLILTDPQHLLQEMSGESTLDNLHILAESVHEDIDPNETITEEANEPESKSEECAGYGTTKRGAGSERPGKPSSATVEIETEEISGVETPLIEVQSVDAVIVHQQSPQKMSAASTTVDELTKQKSVHLSTDDDENTIEDAMSSERHALDKVSAENGDANNDFKTTKLDEDDGNLTKSSLENTASRRPEITIDDYSSQTPEQNADELNESNEREETIASTGHQEHIDDIKLFKPSNLELKTAEIKTIGENSDAAFHDASKDSDHMLAEAYNEHVSGLSKNASVEREDEDTRSTLRAYAENIVSTVLTSCVTRLEENVQTVSGVVATEKTCTEQGVNAENTREDAPTTHIPSDEKIDRSTSPKLEAISQSSSSDVLEPIATRQPAFEEAMAPAERQNQVVSAEMSQSVLSSISSISEENEELVDETPSPSSVKEQRFDATGSEETDNAPATSASAKTSTSDGFPENDSHDASLSAALENSHAVQLSTEQLEVDKGDVGGTAADSSCIASEQVEPTSADSVPDALKASLSSVTKDGAQDNAHADAVSTAELENSHVVQLSTEHLEVDKGDEGGRAPDSSNIASEHVEPTSADNVSDAMKASLGSVTTDGDHADALADAPSNTVLQNSHAVQLSTEQLEVDKGDEGERAPDSSSIASEHVEPTSADNVSDAMKASLGSVTTDGDHADALADAPSNTVLQNSHAVQLSTEQLEVDKGDVGGTAPDSSRIASEQVESTSAGNVPDALKTSVGPGLVNSDGVLVNAYPNAPFNEEFEKPHPVQLSGKQHALDKSEMEETLDPLSTSGVQGEVTSVEDVRSTLTSSEDAGAVTTDTVPSSISPGTQLNVEVVSAQLAPITKEQQQREDANDSGSVSEAVTEEAESSGAEYNHSAQTVRRIREASDQGVEFTSQENGKPDERKRVTDAADSDLQEEDTATLHVPIETEREDNDSEALNSTNEAEPTAFQESKLSEGPPCKSTPPVERKPAVLTPAKDLLEEDTVSDGQEGDTDVAVSSNSESSLTTVSVDAKESVESVSEQSTRESEQASEAISIEAVTIDHDSDRKKDETASNSEPGVVDSSAMPAAAVGTESNGTAMPQENDEKREDDSRFEKSNGTPDLSNRDELHRNIGIPEFRHDSSAYKPAVFESVESFSRIKDPKELFKEVEDKTDGPYFDEDVEEYAKLDDEDNDYFAKHESTIVAENEKDSLGALSTVYESSLEYARPSIEENITAADVSTTASNDHEAVDTTVPSSEHFLPNNAIVVGGVFKQDDYSDVKDVNHTKSGFHESKSHNETFPVEHASHGGHRIEGGREELENETNDPEKQLSSFDAAESLSQEMATVSQPVGVATALDGEAAESGAREKEVSDIKGFKDSQSLRKGLCTYKSAEAVLSNLLQSHHQSDGSQSREQASGERVASGTENTADKENNQGSGKEARSRDPETEAANLAEQLGTEISSAHERSPPSDHAVEEQDEVAAMDFSDEEQPSLEDMHAHNYTVVADVHVSAHQESDDIQDGKLERRITRDATALAEPRFMAAATNDDKEVTNGTTAVTDETEGDTRMQEQAVEAQEPKYVSKLGHPEGPGVEDSSDNLQPAVASLKTAVVVHEETKLEALECSEELLHSVATEADFSSDVYEHTDDGQEDAVIAEANDERASEKTSSTHGNQGSPLEEPESLDSGGAGGVTKEPNGDEKESPKKVPTNDAVEDVIVPEHIPSQSGKSSITESEEGSGERNTPVNGELRKAVEEFSTLVTSGDANFAATDKKTNATVVTPEGPVMPEAVDQKVVPEECDDKVQDKDRADTAANAESGSNAEHEDSMKTDSSESVQLPTAEAESCFGKTSTKRVKEDTTHNVTESVEQSERTEGGGDSASRDRVRSTRIFQKTVLRTESTRTVKKTRSFLPYSRNKVQDDARHAWQDFKSEADVEQPVEEAFVAHQAFDAMSIPRRGLCPMPESPSNGCSVAVQASPSTRDQEAQVEFDEHDCITRLVELQIAMNEQEEVRRQDMKAACELVEKLEAMQLSESLMRSQLRAMDAERREQMAREARLRDELQAWQETVQQQQLLLQQLKEDLDDTEDTLAAQRQEANRLREQVLVLQESCDSGLLMVDVLGRADKEVQTPDGGQHPLSTSSSLKGIRVDDSSPVYLDQLGQHRRLSALVSSQLEATANRIAQLRREALANRTRGGGGGTVDDYIQDLAEKEAIVHQLLLEQQQMDELLSEQ